MTSTDLTGPQNQDDRKRAVPTVFIVVGVVVVLVLAAAFIGGVIFLSANYSAQIEAIRDIFIIALALESCVFGITLILMLIMLIRLVNTVEFEIKPILQQTNETIGTVRGTTKFVSRNVVEPVVTATSYANAVRRGLRTLFGDPRRNLPD